MRRTLLFLLTSLIFLLPSCTRSLTRLPIPEGVPSGPVLVAYRPETQTLVVLNSQVTPAQPTAPEINLPLPSGCVVWNLHPSPSTRWLAIEMECDGGPLVEALHIDSGELRRMSPNLETDSHFLAWHPDGRHIYLRLDALSEPRIVRMDVHTDDIDALPISPYVYDLSVAPDGDRLLYSLTLGIGLGSETWLANADGRNSSLLIKEPAGLVTFARWSPNAQQIAYILMPDSQVPFTIGQLFVLDDAKDAPTPIADVDTGHGYAPDWSPDGSFLAFVVRENPNDPQADTAFGALLSNIYLADVSTLAITPLTGFSNARVDAPAWSPDGRSITASIARNGTIDSWIVNINNIETSLLPQGQATLYPVWLPGK